MIPGIGKVARVVGGRAGIIAIALFAGLLVLMSFAIRVGLSTIESQARQIVELEGDLRTEKALRQSDITGLTALVDGLVVDNLKNEKDQGAIEYALDQAKPNPLSPFMRAYFECLRAQRTGGDRCSTVAIDSAKEAGAD